MTITTFKIPIPLQAHGARPASPMTWMRALLARRVSRCALASLDERLLADIGLTREQALREAAKPMWVA